MVRKTVSHYKIIKKLGGGGMGEVYKAEDTRLGRYVALKFLPEKYTKDRLALERFEREARAASALEHPNICTIHDIGEHESQPFIVMQYLEGKTLRQIMGKKPLETDLVIDFAKQIVAGLEKAHSMGIIHRDIKPANIIVTEDGLAKIVDFGLAKLSAERRAEAEDQMTSPGSAVGTTLYMSPEQVRGENLTPRSDLFSLGVILYEASTGRLPYSGTTAGAVYEEILHKTPIRPVRINPEVSDDLEHIINKCLEKDAELRYQSASELLADLKRLSRDTDRFTIPVTVTPSEDKSLQIAKLLGVVGGIIVLASLLWSSGLFQSAPVDASVGVVPFENASGEPAQDAFADGLTEDIVAQLSKISGLNVYRFKGIEESPVEKAAELGVATLLEGTIRRVEDKIRVSTQLFEVKSSRVLWSENYDQELTDIFALQTEISLQVADALEVELLPSERNEVSESPTDSLEAYDLYLQGRHLRHTQENPVGLHQAVEYFQQAIEQDQEYALAYAGLAECYFLLAYQYGWQSWEEFGDAAKMAVRFGDSLPEPHVAMGLWLDFWEDDEEAADTAFRRALELDPRHSNARREYARFLMRRGRFDEALVENDKVQDPMFAFTVHLTRAEIYRYRGQYEEAVRETLKFREIWSGSELPMELMALCYLALVEYERAEKVAEEISAENPARYRLLSSIYMLQDRMEEAREEAWHLISLQPDSPFSWWLVGYLALLGDDLPQAQANFERAHQLRTKDDLTWWRPYATYLGITYWRSGDKDRADELFAERERLIESSIQKGNQHSVIRKDMAVIHATRGETQEALEWLERAYESGYFWYDLTLKDGLMDSLHDDPRFQELIAEMEARVAEMRERVDPMEGQWAP